MGHFYAVDGGQITPCYEVVGKNGKSRQTTIKDARERRLLPSVNEILSIVANPGLNEWIEREAFGFAFSKVSEASPEQIADEAYRKSVWDAWRTQRESAANRGTLLHDLVLEKGLKGVQTGDNAADAITNHLLERYKGCMCGNEGFFLTYGDVEKCIGCPEWGYAGRFDLLFYKKEDHSYYLVDLKTTKSERKPYEKEYAQIAVYKTILQNIYNIDISSAELLLYGQEDGKFHGGFKLTRDMQDKSLDLFEAAFNLWKIQKSYNPSGARD